MRAKAVDLLAWVELPRSIRHDVHLGTPMVLYRNGKQVIFPVDRIFPIVDARTFGIAGEDLTEIPL